MRSALLHIASDVAISLGAALAGLVILVTGGWYWLAPAVSLLISAVVGARVKSTIGGRFRISQTTLELECEACGVPGDLCAIETVRSKR